MGIWSVKVLEGSILSGRARSGSATTLKDDAKNMATDIFKDKFIKIIIDDIEYVRKITSHTADTFTFGAIVAAVAAKAVIDNTTGGGGKLTITADPAGTYANDYTVATVAGEGASAETEAAFADGVLTLTLGTDAGAVSSAEIGTGTDGVVTITRKEVGDEFYQVQVLLQTADKPLTAYMVDGNKLYVALGTDENGDPDATKNTAALIATKINNADEVKDLFIAAASGDGSGVFSEIIPGVSFEGGADPVVDATAAEIKTAIEAIEGGPFTVVADAAGAIGVLENPVSFSGGVDEVKPVDRTEYFVI